MASAGSAPRVRGTHDRHHARWHPRRFSPACAGNAVKYRRRRRCMAVQPRVCGERVVEEGYVRAGYGSAPRVRGTHQRSFRRRRARRFSPACAGNASTKPPTSGIASVQPRVCGERRKLFAAADPDDGSAPRVRGTLFPHPADLRERRFSPACAGNATEPIRRAQPHAVQPRVCGERGSFKVYDDERVGSAPRVRGTLHESTGIRLRQRFSPACAGNARTHL